MAQRTNMPWSICWVARQRISRHEIENKQETQTQAKTIVDIRLRSRAVRW